jgi:hypothetical protein
MRKVKGGRIPKGNTGTQDTSPLDHKFKVGDTVEADCPDHSDVLLTGVVIKCLFNGDTRVMVEDGGWYQTPSHVIKKADIPNVFDQINKLK